jgi:hypothetical protein
MNKEQLRELAKQLWDAEDQFRRNSNPTAAEYKDLLLSQLMVGLVDVEELI